MKKLFFFRSSGSGNGSNNAVPPPSTDKQVYWENISDVRTSPCLRRSLSFTSAAFHDGGLGQSNFSCSSDQSGSSCSSSNISLKQSDRRSSRCRTPTPERQNKAKCYEATAGQNTQKEKLGCASSTGTGYDSSESSSYCSSNVSNNVLDRYIDGEQQQEKNIPKRNSCERRNHSRNGNGSGRLPPRTDHTTIASRVDSVKEKPTSHSFRESRGSQLYFTSRDCVEKEFGLESPRSLAKHVIERLSQSRVLPQTNSKEFDPDVPITIEDIYGGSLNKWASLNSEGVPRSSCLRDGSEATTNGYHPEEISGFQEQNWFPRDNCGALNSIIIEEESDTELLRKSKEAEQLVMVLSEELEQENFLQNCGFSVPALVQAVRNLTEDKLSMAIEVSAMVQTMIAERASAKEEIRLAKTELDSRTRRLEKEKNELQLALEKELDRRSSDWSIKLEKYQAEERRLRERVRELAEQNVSLQREVSLLKEKEMETRSRMAHSELQLNGLTTRMGEAREENEKLLQHLSELQERCRAAEEDRDCIRSNYEDKEKECKELHRSITRLLRSCSEQEKTIDGLRKGLGEELKRSCPEDSGKQLEKLQMEQIRLTGVEQALRKEVESYRLEVETLRQENINLLHRLKGSGKEGGFSTFKLEQELQNRVCCLQNQGLSLLNESTLLCLKLLDYIKEKAGQIPESKQGTESVKNGLDGQFVVETDMKVQGFKRGAEILRRSLQTVSAVLHGKSNLVALESHSQCLEDESGQQSSQRLKDIIKSELKAETLLTSLLREKLYSKELDAEQLQAELSSAVRGNDILRFEVQNAMDMVSCVTHKMKDLELQIIKKDESINRLQNDLQECTKELILMRGTLPKLSEERDLMWEEVKQYSEKNMLLNSEISSLKKKMEALDEEILLKEGQITILKDSLGRPFDLLGSPGSTQEFLLE